MTISTVKMNPTGVTQGAADTDVASTPPELQQLRDNLVTAQEKIKKLIDESSEYLSEEQLNELNRYNVTMNAQVATIDAYGISGNHPANSTDSEEDPFINPNLPEGWNGNLIESPDQRDAAYIATHADRYGEYVTTFESQMNNNADDIAGLSVGNTFTFKKSNGETVTIPIGAIYGESHGKDAIWTIVDRNDPTKKYSWVDKGRSENGLPFIIDTTRNTQGVTIDLSRIVQKKSDGQFNNFYIWTGSGNDQIRGSQGKDGIVGGAGNDTIFGMGGIDEIYGDGKGIDQEGGNDTISGGAGVDIITGGRGLDTGYDSDYEPGSYNAEMEPSRRKTDSGSAAIPGDMSWFQSSSNNTDWEAVETDGMVVATNKNGVGGEITIDMQQMSVNGITYSMAFAEKDTDGSLILTFVGEDAERNPKTFKLKIKDFFDFNTSSGEPKDSSILLTLKGTDRADMLDFSQVDSGRHTFKLEGRDGDDMIIAPEHQFLSFGMEYEKLVQGGQFQPLSQGLGRAQLEEKIRDGIINEPDASKFEAETIDGETIEIKLKTTQPPNPQNNLNLVMPTDYTEAYLVDDPAQSGGYYLIFVKPSEHGAETMVMHIDSGLGLAANKINVWKAGADSTQPKVAHTPIYLSSHAIVEGFKIEGGADADTIYAQKGYRIVGRTRDDHVSET